MKLGRFEPGSRLLQERAPMDRSSEESRQPSEENIRFKEEGTKPNPAPASSASLAAEVNPLVTVGIFGYNHEKYIRAALSSVKSQTYKNLEIVVVDDGSTDGTLQELEDEAADDTRVQIIADGKNLGLAGRLNQVVDLARGSWLSVLGGDDAYLPDGIETMVRAAKNQSTVIWGDLIVIDEEGNELGYARPRDTWQGSTASRYLEPRNPLTDLYKVNNFVSGTTPLIRTRAIQAVGGYTPDVLNEDLDLWLRLAPGHLFQYVGKPVGRYRVISGSSSRSEERMTADQAKIFRRLANDPRYSKRGLARLLAMRWALSVARTRGRPPNSLGQLSEASSLKRSLVVQQAFPSIMTPILGSLKAKIMRSSSQ